MKSRSIREILTLEQLDENSFGTLETTEYPGRSFGGALVGQAVMAAGHTAPADRPVHSVHGHFLRPGDSSSPTTYRVENLRDGSTYSARRVIALQKGAQLVDVTVSFHVGDTSDLTFQRAQPRSGAYSEVPTAPSPPDLDDDTAVWAARLSQWLGVELRFPEPPARARALAGVASPAGRQSVWLRSLDDLGDDALLHRAALAYCSDLLLLSTGLAPHGRTFSDADMQFASLDHTIWLHQPVRADEWFHHDMQAQWNGHGRSLTTGAILDGSGRLIASTAQEGVIRSRPARQGK
jgi:acyl-CoA thioesterase-2